MFPVLISWAYDYDERVKFCLNQEFCTVTTRFARKNIRERDIRTTTSDQKQIGLKIDYTNNWAVDIHVKTRLNPRYIHKGGGATSLLSALCWDSYSGRILSCYIDKQRWQPIRFALWPCVVGRVRSHGGLAILLRSPSVTECRGKLVGYLMVNAQSTG